MHSLPACLYFNALGPLVAEPNWLKNHLYLVNVTMPSEALEKSDDEIIRDAVRDEFRDWRSRTKPGFERLKSDGPDMSVHQVLKAASGAGISLRVDGPVLVVEADTTSLKHCSTSCAAGSRS